jgi:hypothetical protein
VTTPFGEERQTSNPTGRYGYSPPRSPVDRRQTAAIWNHLQTTLQTGPGTIA